MVQGKERRSEFELYMSIQFWRKLQKKKRSGDNSTEVTPVPIPNTEVKLCSADDTWRATAWESRTLPVYLEAIHDMASFFLEEYFKRRYMVVPFVILRQYHIRYIKNLQIHYILLTLSLFYGIFPLHLNASFLRRNLIWWTLKLKIILWNYLLWY